MSDKNYYKILGMPENAGTDQIKSAYRQLAKKYHPDMNPTNRAAAEQKFKEISEAYYVLGDPKRRQEYDLYRRGGAGPGAGRVYNPAEGFDFEDLLSHMGFGGRGGRPTGRRAQMNFDIFDDILSQFFSADFGNGPTRVYTMNSGGRDRINTDVEAEVDIPKPLAQNGGKVDIRLGKGKTLSVKIPAGTASGTKLRLKGAGHECPHCQKRGDIFLKVRVK